MAAGRISASPPPEHSVRHGVEHAAIFRDLRLLLDRAGRNDLALAPFAASAALNRTGLRKEVLAAGAIGEDALYAAYAAELGLPFDPQIVASRLLIGEAFLANSLGDPAGLTMALAEGGGANATIYSAPVVFDLDAARRVLTRYPEVRSRLRITTPGALRRAAIARSRPALLDRAISGLLVARPDLSARSTASAWQGAMLGAFVAALPVALALRPLDTVFALHLAASLFFMSNALLRVIAAFTAKPIEPAPIPGSPTGQTETYSVLVALYREADVVSDLLLALGRLEWPRSRIEIKLVCEEDDAETIAAINAHALRPSVELVVVPNAQPRTKPKALNYALQLCSGEFVVIYDAEDRPDPMQLVEARRAFARLPSEVGCLQAPLDIGNGGESVLAGLFAMEYRALFHGLLPWLAKAGLIIPLGGTSNHFRREAIEQVMAWDAYNVTEDADLGLKLYRLGYRVGMLTRPTIEDAPTEYGVWIKQRTRWLKGWMQTWLVHMRNPLELYKNIGLKSFLISQILFAGMFVSALAHMFILIMLISIGTKYSMYPALDAKEKALLLVDTFNVIAGYTGLIVLARRTTAKAKRRGFWRIAAAVPVYWIAMSIAAWRATWQLLRRPHMWEKTPHRPHGAPVDP